MFIITFLTLNEIHLGRLRVLILNLFNLIEVLTIFAKFYCTVFQGWVFKKEEKKQTDAAEMWIYRRMLLVA